MREVAWVREVRGSGKIMEEYLTGLFQGQHVGFSTAIFFFFFFALHPFNISCVIRPHNEGSVLKGLSQALIKLMGFGRLRERRG